MTNRQLKTAAASNLYPAATVELVDSVFAEIEGKAARAQAATWKRGANRMQLEVALGVGISVLSLAISALTIIGG